VRTWRHRPAGRSATALAAVGLLIGGLLVGCGSAGTTGGASALPSAVPAGVEYHPMDGANPAPGIVGELLDGTAADAVDLLAGRPTVISFVASWGTVCGAEMQTELAKIAEKYGAAVNFVAVAGDGRDTRQDLESFVAKAAIRGPVVFDPDLATWRNYAVREAPATGLTDSAGQLVRLWNGSQDAATLEEVLDTLITLPN